MPWLKGEFGWKETSARNFINLYGMSNHAQRVAHSNLPLRSLYLLANRSTPDTVREEMLSRAKVSHKNIVERIRHSKGGKAAALTDERCAASAGAAMIVVRARIIIAVIAPPSGYIAGR
jgi:hypothetical protein